MNGLQANDSRSWRWFSLQMKNAMQLDAAPQEAIALYQESAKENQGFGRGDEIT